MRLFIGTFPFMGLFSAVAEFTTRAERAKIHNPKLEKGVELLLRAMS